VTPEAESIMKMTKKQFQRSIFGGFVITTITGLSAIGCGPDGNSTTTGTSSTSGSTSGGTTTACLEESTYSDVVTIVDAGFCVVGSYDVDSVKGSLTWGSHGGPMFVVASMDKAGSIDVTRLSVPDMATTGKLTTGTNSVDVGLPMGSFLGAQVLDLPFFNWSLISYTNGDLTGKIIMFEGNNILLNYPINGFFSAAAVIGADEPLGRIVYSGLSPIFKNATNTNALYAADACGELGNKPRLVSDGDATCSDSFPIETFGKYAGPVAADTTGNVFSVMSLENGQEARGYAAETVKRGAGPTMGASMFQVPGFAGSLAAVAPDGTGVGVLVFQPQEFDMASGMSIGKDVIAQRFKVEGGKIINEGLNGPFMTPVKLGEVLNFTSDDQDRIWVAAKRGTGYAMLVLARKN
jgi:hypothetical protein